MSTTTLKPIGEVNSTTYQDLTGLYVGLQRFAGETATAFKSRLEINANNLKKHNYDGTVENISTRLGLSLFEVMSITTTYNDAFFDYDFGSIKISSTEETLNIPTITITPDGIWQWNTISSVVTAINASSGYHATLLCEDGPALQIARQHNSNWAVNEVVTGQVYQLAFGGEIAGTELFNQTVNSYTITNGILTTDQSYTNLTVSYRYKIWPYIVIGSPAAVISLVDESIQPYLQASNGALVYQVQEIIQALMNADGSYWAA